MKLTRNVGGVDRTLRLLLGIAGIAVGLYLGWGWLAAVGALIFLSGLLGRCGLYYLLGVSTCPARKS